MSVASLSGYAPKRRFDQKAWTAARIEGAALEIGPWSEVELFTFDVPDADPENPRVRNFTTEEVDADTTNFLRVVFLDEDGDQDATDPLALAPGVTLTTVAMVATRLARALSDAETAQAALFIGYATTGIFACLDRNILTWAPKPEDRPLLSMLCTEIVSRVMINPEDLQRHRVTIGSYTEDKLFAPRAAMAPGLYPTPQEELLIRNAVFGSNTGSVRLGSIMDDYVSVIPWSSYWYLYFGIGDGASPYVVWY